MSGRLKRQILRASLLVIGAFGFVGVGGSVVSDVLVANHCEPVR
jgi:hypothetical protein